MQFSFRNLKSILHRWRSASARLPARRVRDTTRTSVAIPLQFAYNQTTPRICVICHIFHVQMAAEIRRLIEHVAVAADIIVTTDTTEKQARILDAFSGWNAGKLDVRLVPNRGRDIAPKLIAARDAYDSYDIVLHIHSKLSEHTEFLKTWRSYLFATLAGSPEIVRSILTIFAVRPDVGMIAPQHFPHINHWIDWGDNFPAAAALAQRMGFRLDSARGMDFPSGSMFWARSAALKPLLDLNLGYDAFEPECGQTDGTLAHAIERLYFHVCERAGYRWLKIADPRLFEDASDIVRVNAPADLDRVMDNNSRTLL